MGFHNPINRLIFFFYSGPFGRLRVGPTVFLQSSTQGRMAQGLTSVSNTLLTSDELLLAIITLRSSSCRSRNFFTRARADDAQTDLAKKAFCEDKTSSITSVACGLLVLKIKAFCASQIDHKILASSSLDDKGFFNSNISCTHLSVRVMFCCRSCTWILGSVQISFVHGHMNSKCSTVFGTSWQRGYRGLGTVLLFYTYSFVRNVFWLTLHRKRQILVGVISSKVGNRFPIPGICNLSCLVWNRFWNLRYFFDPRIGLTFELFFFLFLISIFTTK